MTSPSPLLLDTYYHLFNRGNNRQNIFLETRNYDHFLKLYSHYVEPVAETFAYCLLRNHLHILIRTRSIEEQKCYYRTMLIPTKQEEDEFQSLDPSHQFGKLFNAYAKAINKAYGFVGSLFQHPFWRIPVTSNSHFTQLITYIHYNPQKHGFVSDFREWPFSSYKVLLSEKPTCLAREEVRNWFGDLDNFSMGHNQPGDWQVIQKIVGDDIDDQRP